MDYMIDFNKLTIHNAESNGAKPIEDVVSNHGLFHLSYINDDGRRWWQLVTEYEADRIVWETEAQAAMVDNAYYGLGEGLLL